MEIKERNQKILRLALENYNFTEIGIKFNISRERVRQIVKPFGIVGRKMNRRAESFRPNYNGLTRIEQFWLRVDKKGMDECWEWTGCKNNVTGYGVFSFRNKINTNKEATTHRLAYWFYYKRRPKLHVLHSCDNRICVNPHHLREGTQAENVQDRQTRGYDKWYANLCAGAKKAGSYKLTKQNVIEIRQKRFPASYYATKFNISEGYVAALRSKACFANKPVWKDAPFPE